MSQHTGSSRISGSMGTNSRLFVGAAVFLTVLASCSRNPATRRLQALMPDDTQEVALGREADLQLREVVRIYDELPELTRTVRRVGERIASVSERPSLPWSFEVGDDWQPNAFALPGGSVYITRGLLAHLNSEAELAAVLAHEVAHVAARHGVRALARRARVQHRHGRSSLESQVPELAIAGTTALSRSLARSRDDELAADDLAMRYLDRANYPKVALADVLQTLGRLHGSVGIEPSETHPTTVHRRVRVLETSAARHGDYDPDWLALVEGLAFGPDPRDGYLDDGTFIHPDMGFALQLPRSWTVAHQAGRTVAKSPNADTILVVAQSDAESVRAGMNSIFLGNVQKKNPWQGELEGHTSAMAEFATEASVHAFVGFIEFEGKIVQAVAYSPVAEWPAHEARQAFESFTSATRRQRDVEPMHLESFTVERTATLAEIYEESPSSVPLSVVARINGVEPDATVPAGRILKRVSGFNPDFSSVAKSE